MTKDNDSISNITAIGVVYDTNDLVHQNEHAALLVLKRKTKEIQAAREKLDAAQYELDRLVNLIKFHHKLKRSQQRKRERAGL